MIKKEVYKISEERFGFKIYVNEELRIIQEFKPNVEGWQPMTKEEAEAEADKLIAQILAPPPPQPITEEVILSTGKRVTVTYTSSEALTSEELIEVKTILSRKAKGEI